MSENFTNRGQNHEKAYVGNRTNDSLRIHYPGRRGSQLYSDPRRRRPIHPAPPASGSSGMLAGLQLARPANLDLVTAGGRHRQPS